MFDSALKISNTQYLKMDFLKNIQLKWFQTISGAEYFNVQFFQEEKLLVPYYKLQTRLY